MTNQPTGRRVVVITGASSGIGRDSAVAFAREGAAVAVAARRDELLDELVAECAAAGGEAIAVPTDVSDPDAVRELAQATIDRFDRIDVWVNGAGVAALGRFDDVPLADHTQVIATDLLGALYGSYFALQHFKRQGAGTLINVSSVLGRIPAPYYASYAAAKFGIVGLSGALRQELAESSDNQIHVCTVLPMAMDTPFFEHAANYTGHEAVPIPPVYDPTEAVDAILRLADDPEDEVVVGGAGNVVSAFHAIAPGLTERLLGKETHLVQTNAPPAPPTTGNVHIPVASGTELHGDS